MGLSRPRPRRVPARRRRPDLLRPSSYAATATGSGPPASTSLHACCLSAGALPSTLAQDVLPAPPVAAGYVEDALWDVGEYVLDAPPRQMSAAPAAALAAAAAMLAHRRSDPAIGGRMVRRSPRPKPATAATPASPACPVPFPCLCDAARELDSSSSSRPLPPPERRPGVEDEVQVVLETAPRSLLASPRASAPAFYATSVTAKVGSQRPSSCCFQGNGDWLGCFASSPGHSGHTVSAPPQLDSPEAGHGLDFSGSNRPHRMANAAFRRPDFIARSAPPAWLRDRCYRCLSKGHKVRACRSPIRCMSCLQFGHIARSCRAKPCIDQSLPVQCAAPPSTLAEEEEATPTYVSVQSALAEQAELLRSELQGCLARVGSFLARAEASLGRLPVAPIVAPLVGVLDGSADGGEADLFGAFSPRGRPYTPALHAMSAVSKSEVTVDVVAPVLQIMPELMEMCGEPHSPVSMVHLKVDLPEASAVPLAPTTPPPEPTQPLAFVDCGVIPHSSESTTQEVSVDDEVCLSGALAQVPGALFARKLCDFLVSLEADDPGSGKTIGCLLEERAIRKRSKKVESSILKEKSFKSKSKKSGSLRKVAAAGG